MARMTGFIYQDRYRDQLKGLSDQEVGRLVRALSDYHATGEVQELKGRESMAYEFIRFEIDEAEKGYQAKCETNRKNRTGTTVDDGQRTLTNVNERQQSTTPVPNININKKNINKRVNINDDDDDASSRTHTRTREENGTLSSVDQIIGIEKTEQDDPRHHAEQLVKRFGLPQVDDVIETVANDIEMNGLCDVQAAFLKAATSDKHGGISLNYYKTILANKDLPPPQKHNGQKDPVEETRRKEWLEQSDF